MIYRISIVVLLGILFLACNKSKKASNHGTPEREMNSSTYYSSSQLIEVEKLENLIVQENVAIIDFRRPEEYAINHIPGAINIWRTDVEDTIYPYRGMMASKEHIEHLFSSLGIKNQEILVIYDDLGACDAARLWWILKNYDVESVKLLNGGLSAWKDAGKPMDAKHPTIVPSTFLLPTTKSFRFWIGKDEMINLVTSKSKEVILDTRSFDEFSGAKQKRGASKAGRIPGSVLIDWAEAIDFENNQKFRSFDELERIYTQIGVSKNHPIITYCHSGVRSAHTTFVLTELLGYQNVKNYDGSWVEWSYYDELPIEKDNITATN